MRNLYSRGWPNRERCEIAYGKPVCVAPEGLLNAATFSSSMSLLRFLSPSTLLVLLALELGILPSSSAETRLKIGAFEAVLAEDNAWLPVSIRWIPGDVEILRPETGLNLSFTSFEFRNKIYREENKNVWKGKTEPRFLTDIRVLGKQTVAEGDFEGIAVDLEASWARIQRRLLLHRSAPKLRLAYTLEFTRDVILHEAAMLGVDLQFDAGFDESTVPDARGGAGATLTAVGLKGATHRAGLLHAGPVLLTHSARQVTLLIRDAHAGEELDRPSANLLVLKKGKTLTFSIAMGLGPKDDPTLRGEFAKAAVAISSADRPFLLVADARHLEHQGKLKEAEEALLEAGKLNPEYATPFAALAALRRDHKLPGETAAWLDAGYRMPYNYGYMLSGSGLFASKDLTEAQRHQHLFNVLIAVENANFYPDYYLWAARGFLKLNMLVQACAMYRQALWSVDFMPRNEETKEKLRQDYRKVLADLEEQIRTGACTNLPQLIPVPAQKP